MEAPAATEAPAASRPKRKQTAPAKLREGASEEEVKAAAEEQEQPRRRRAKTARMMAVQTARLRRLGYRLRASSIITDDQ